MTCLRLVLFTCCLLSRAYVKLSWLVDKKKLDQLFETYSSESSYSPFIFTLRLYFWFTLSPTLFATYFIYQQRFYKI